jgi:hypothetical protein
MNYKTIFSAIAIISIVGVSLITIQTSAVGWVDNILGATKSKTQIATTSTTYVACGKQNGKCFCGKGYTIVTNKGSKRCKKNTPTAVAKKRETPTKVADTQFTPPPGKGTQNETTGGASRKTSNQTPTKVAGKFFTPDPKYPAPKRASGSGSRYVEPPKDIDTSKIG